MSLAVDPAEVAVELTEDDDRRRSRDSALVIAQIVHPD
jgi:hypothetical protein